jgi:GT2 family glycosyltransferase
VSKSEPPLVDVYIIHWNAPEWCVDAAASILRSEGVRVRCHVLDNDSSGGPALSQALDPRVDLIPLRRNLGYSGAANEGFAHAFAEAVRPEFVAIAAHDAHVDPNSLAILCDTARSNPKIGIVGPVLTAPAVEAGGWWRGWRARATSAWNSDVSFEDRDWVSGTLLLARLACIEEIGGFDERLGSYVEDVDLCLRACDRGWRVGIATGARASGIGSSSSSVTFMVDVNSVMVAAKRRGVKSAFGILLRYAYWIVRGLVAALDLRRTTERRSASLAHSRDHARAIGYLVRHWSQVREFTHDPDGGVRTFS